MEEIRLTYKDIVFYAVVANTTFGLLFGFFPLITGLKLGNRKLAFIGFFGSFLIGVVGVIFSFPFAAVTQWLIVRGGRSSSTFGEGDDTATSPLKSSQADTENSSGNL